MRRSVDEVRMGDQRGREADGRTVESDDEDLRVRVEGAGDVDVVGHETAGEFPADAAAQFAGVGADASYVCAAVWLSVS